MADLSPTIIEALPAMIAKLEAAAGPDRDLDAEIAVALSGDPEAWVVNPSPHSIFSPVPGWWRTSDDESHEAPAFTASLDAAVSLVGRVLPEYWWLSRSDEVEGGFGNLGPIGTSPNDGGPGYPSYARTAPLALCLSVLRALTSQASGEGE